MFMSRSETVRLAPAVVLVAVVSGGAMTAPRVQDVAAEYSELSDAYDETLSQLYSEIESVPRDERAKVYYQKLDGIDAEYQVKFDALASKSKGTETAAKSLVWVAKLSAAGRANTPECERRATVAFDVLVSDHIKSDALETLAGALADAHTLDTACDAALTKMYAASPHRLVQASSLHSLALRGMSRMGDDANKRAEVRKRFIELKEKYSDLADQGGRSYGKLCDGTLFEIDNLQIGMVVPDMEATDETGTKFKLSDYRGKVVVVDFWGFW